MIVEVLTSLYNLIPFVIFLVISEVVHGTEKIILPDAILKDLGERDLIDWGMLRGDQFIGKTGQYLCN